MALTLAVGVPIGALAAYVGGWFDEVLMRFADIFLAFPTLVLALAIAAALGPDLRSAVVAIAVTLWPRYARVVRGQVLSVKQREYVLAARGLGSPPWRIVLETILPNVLSVVAIVAIVDIGSVTLAGATLSFLGLGVSPPAPEWGAMVSGWHHPPRRLVVDDLSRPCAPDLRHRDQPLRRGPGVRKRLRPAAEGLTMAEIATTVAPRPGERGGDAPLLAIEQLSVDFSAAGGVVHAVRGISLDVRVGETVGIVGESGSGKSASALALLRLLPGNGHVAGGRAMFGNRDLLTLPEGELRDVRGGRIAMIYQDPLSALNPVLTVGRQLTEVLQRHLRLGSRAAGDRAVDLLNMVGIPNPRARLNDYPHQFSGGMRQRVMIAMAIAASPP